MTNSVALLPCPFCGGTDQLVVDVIDEDADYSGWCQSCGTTGPCIDTLDFFGPEDGFNTEAAELKAQAKARDAWNARPREGALEARIAELEHWARIARGALRNPHMVIGHKVADDCPMQSEIESRAGE